MPPPTRPIPTQKLSGTQPREGGATTTRAYLEYHSPTHCGYHNNRGLFSRQSRQLPVEELSHIPAATVPAD